MANPAAVLMRKKYGRILPEAEIQLPLSKRQFFKFLTPGLCGKVLAPLQIIDAKVVLGTFVDQLYKIYIRSVDSENLLASRRHNPSLIRPHLKRYTRVRSDMETVLEQLGRAEMSLGSSAEELRADVLDFEGPRKQLLRLARTLRELECDCALLIPPPLKKPAEKALASSSKLRVKHLTMAVRKNSAETQYMGHRRSRNGTPPH